MVIIFNPAAGRRRLGRLALVLGALRESGIRLDVLETRGPGHALALARQAAAQGAGRVVVAGGDGTIAEVAHGILGSGARLGIIPLGTANVLAHELALPRHPAALARVLAGEGLRWLRPGVASYPDGRERLFVQMLGCGFDAAVVGALDAGLKRWLGRGAYALQAVREAVRYPFPPLEVELDGTAQRCASLVVSKGRFYGGRHLLVPAARPDAPGFQVALFPRGGPWRALLAGAALPLGLLPRLPELVLLPAVRLVLPAGAPLQLDGDTAPAGPAVVEEAACALPVLVPAQAGS